MFSFPFISIIHGSVRYEKVGRLIPGENDTIRMMLDVTGEIGMISTEACLRTNGIGNYLISDQIHHYH